MFFLTKVDLDLSCSCPYLWAFVFPFLFIWLHPGIVIYYTLDTSRHMRRSCLVLWADQIDQSTLVIRSIKPLRFGGRDLSPTHVSYVIRLTLDRSLFQQMAGNFAIFWSPSLEAPQGIADSKTQEFRMMLFGSWNCHQKPCLNMFEKRWARALLFFVYKLRVLLRLDKCKYM